MAKTSQKEEKGKKKKSRSYRGLSPKQRREERRERLLVAGLELFGTQGFRATTIEQLCKRARVTTRHFYEEFKSREEMFRAVYDRAAAHISHGVMSAITRAPEEPSERVRMIIGAVVRSMMEDPRIARVHMKEAAGLGESFFERIDESYRDLARLLEREAQSAAQRENRECRDFDLIAQALAAGMVELMVQGLIHKPSLSTEKIIDVIVRLFFLAAGIRDRTS